VTLNQLRAFLAAARTGSFTAAAAEIQLSQAAVSELVRRLEQEHDVTLFQRGRRTLVLTDAGQELVPHAEQSVAAADDASRALRSVQSLRGGVATFGVLRNADYYLLSGLVARFHAAHPHVRTRMVGLNSVQVAGEVAAGTLEAGLVVLPVATEGLIVTPLVRDEVIFVSSDPARVAAPMTVERLAEMRLILYDAHSGWHDPTRRQIAERAALAGLKLQPWIEVEHVETALNLVAAGAGDTFTSRAVAASPGCPPGLGSVAFDPPIYDTIALVRRENRPLSPATREIALLAQQMLHESDRVEDLPGMADDWLSGRRVGKK
jgi:DNA-binding transcriptional LysR family regulator